MNKSRERTITRRNNYSPIIEFKGMEFCDSADKELKIAVLKTLNDLQGNSKKIIQ